MQPQALDLKKVKVYPLAERRYLLQATRYVSATVDWAPADGDTALTQSVHCDVWVERGDQNRARYGFKPEGLRLTVELHGGQKLSVELGTIHRGDILVFKAPPSENCGEPVVDLVKRVIGLPGDHLSSRGNTIFVNGAPLRETWTHTEPLGQAIGHVTVPANQYFMMGDNHSDSCDSRMWGTVPKSDIIGKAFVRIWPIGRLGFL